MESEMDARKLLETVTRLAIKVGLDEERTARAVCIAWNDAKWFEAEHGWCYPPGHWARLGVRKALSGRDLPGLHPAGRQDALDHAMQGCGMGEVMDRRPGPEKEAADREMIANWWSALTARERLVLDLLDTGMLKRDIARRIGVTASRLSQILQGIVEKAE